MLTVDNVVTSYGMIKALKGVSLTAESGKITCLLGPNGAGKTTLMYTIAGILKAQAGTITLDSTEITRQSPVKIVKHGVALVPENRLVFPRMTVQENLETGAYLSVGKNRRGIADDLERTFARFPQLRERSDQLAGTLSGGRTADARHRPGVDGEATYPIDGRALPWTGATDREGNISESLKNSTRPASPSSWSSRMRVWRSGSPIISISSNKAGLPSAAHRGSLKRRKSSSGPTWVRSGSEPRGGAETVIDFIQNCIDGVMIGSSYALLAIGFTIIFGVLRRINLAYGPSIMLGAFVGTLLYVQFQAQIFTVAIATVIAAVLVGMYVERLCFWAIRRGAAAASMVSSFAIWMQLEEVATVILPERTYPFPALTEIAPIEIGPFFLRSEHLTMFVIAVMMPSFVAMALTPSKDSNGCEFLELYHKGPHES